MVRIVRILSVALLSLPLLAGSASAECAWVLWVEESWVVALQRDERPTEWTLVGAFGSQADCHRSQAEKITTLAKGDEAQVAFNIVSKKSPTGYQDLRVICVPDTVDPRGPKGR